MLLYSGWVMEETKVVIAAGPEADPLVNPIDNINAKEHDEAESPDLPMLPASRATAARLDNIRALDRQQMTRTPLTAAQLMQTPGPQIVINNGRSNQTPSLEAKRTPWWARVTPNVTSRNLTRSESDGIGADIINDEKETIWRSLCFRCDPKAIVFFSQLFVILLVMVFCMYQLITIKDVNEKQYYFGTLTFILGLLCPNPSIKRKQ
jgi:hypothetical protein